MASNSKLKKPLKNSPVAASKSDSETSSLVSTEETPEITETETPEPDDIDLEEVDEDENGPQTDEDVDGGTDDTPDAESPADGQAAPETAVYTPDPTKRYAGGIPKGRIIPLGEDVTLDVDVRGTVAVIKEDTYKEVLPTGSKRIAFVRLYRAGQTVPATSIAAVPSDEK